MTLNQLRYFCMASRCHSITKAAEELYVTQPTVSVAIRDLEIEFGVSLFSRKGNQLILTREGRNFIRKQIIFSSTAMSCKRIIPISPVCARRSALVFRRC